MLTKNDLKLIGDVVHERLEIKLEEKLEEKLESKFEEKLSPIRKDIKGIRKKMNKMNRILNLVAKNHDLGDVTLDRRVSLIEQSLGMG